MCWTPPAPFPESLISILPSCHLAPTPSLATTLPLPHSGLARDPDRDEGCLEPQLLNSPLPSIIRQRFGWFGVALINAQFHPAPVSDAIDDRSSRSCCVDRATSLFGQHFLATRWISIVANNNHILQPLGSRMLILMHDLVL